MLIAIEATHANKSHRTGVEWYCFHIIQELKKIIPADTRVILYSNSALRDGLEILPSNWEVKILNWPLKKLWSQTRLAYELWKNPPDVFFAPGQLIPWYVPKNTVATIHDSAFMADAKSYWWASRWYLQWMNRLIIKKAKKIILTADFNLRELKKYYGEAVGEKCMIVPLAYDKEKYKMTLRDSSARLGMTGGGLSGITDGSPYIISISRLEEKKNTARIVGAFNILKRNFSSLKLVLAGGPGVGYEKVKQAIDASPYKSDIILPGYVSNDDLPRLLAGATAFVFPSLYEGFGIPVLEAMACGVPVVAANNTALPEVGGNAAMYIDPLQSNEIADAVTKILYDPELHQRMIVFGLRRAEQFSWAKTAAQTYDIIRQ